MSVPTQVVKLVDQFKDQSQAVKSSGYKEDWVRRDYIDHFFKALGWDVDRQKSGPLIYKEVVHEASLKVEGAMKAPDYSFRTGGATKFFVEAKKPSVNLWDGKAAAFQVRRYAWTASLPLSILTDFEELAIYDCQIKPLKEDKASTARRIYMTYEEYPDRWDEIASLFSKEAVLSGSLDSYAQELKKKRGTATVDQEFLKEMEGWRGMLAKDLAKRNPSLTSRELNYAVQMTIDRIIFLRICEARDIEDYGKLERLLDKENVYNDLRSIFRDADDRYNSGLFHFKREKRDELPDELTLNLELADQPLKKLIKGLYYPEPYQFSVMPVELLGQVYEQFLGKIINLTPDHRATVEEKPEVRKAGGVYYTPSYIVEYIVKNTVGKLLEGKTPKQVSKLKILDPACGSGSFLVGAYDYLLEWHRKFYVNDGPDKHTKLLYEGLGGEWQLTSAKKKEILLNNIYGVDLDSQAVEVTKLSLLLKVLEGETNETINSQLTFFKERALPDLDNNIKSGNSLIGADFYSTAEMSLLNGEERYRINPFDWETEFSEIMERGGFDAVIGNPPYLKEYTYSQPFRDLHGTRLHKYYQGKMDLWYVFACLSVDLLKHNGLHSFIGTNNWITNKGAETLRKKLNNETQMYEFVDFGNYKVFDAAGIQTMIYLVKKTDRPRRNQIRYRRITDSRITIADVKNFLFANENNDFAVSFNATVESENNGQPFTFIHEKEAEVLRHIITVGSYRLGPSDVATGIDVHQDFVTQKHVKSLGSNEVEVGDGIFVLSNAEKRELNLTAAEEDVVKPYYTTQELNRYYGDDRNKLWVIYTNPAAVARIGEYPNLKAHLDKFAPIITSDNRPYGLHRAREERFFLGEKIVSLRKTHKPHFTYTDFPCYVSQTYFVLKPTDVNLKYLVGILNSRLCHFWLDRKGKKQGEALQIDKAPLLDIPIRPIDFTIPTDEAHHDRMVDLVEQMLKLHDQLSNARTAYDKTSFRGKPAQLIVR